MMTLLSRLATVFTLLSLVFLSQVQARSLGEIQKAGTIVLLSEGGFYPFSYFEGEHLTGYEIDVGNALAKRLGVKVVWRTIGFDSILPAITQGRGDAAIASHSYTEDRAKLVAFASPHYCSGAVVVAAKGGPLTVTALKNKTLGVQMATTFVDEAKKVPNVKKIKLYQTEQIGFDALIHKKVDAIVADKLATQAALSKLHDARIVIGDQITSERISLIVRKDNKELLAKINQLIDELTREGILRALSEKYMHADITCPTAT